MRYKVIDEINGLETYKMRCKRRLLAISIASLLLTTAFLMPSFRKLYPAQSAASRREAANENRSPLSVRRESRLDRERFEEIRQVLNMIEKGQAALQLIDAYEVGVGFEYGEGSGFYPYRNQIVIDSRFGKFSAALKLIHEATHARYFHEGLAADIALHDRGTYVQLKMEEELDAMVTGIEATSELWEAGVDISKLRPFYYYPYKHAHGSAFRAAKHDHPELDAEALHYIGRAAGESVVLEFLYGGQVVTSLTRQTYLEYWGSVWDAKMNSDGLPNPGR
jgi:hypothetical protein